MAATTRPRGDDGVVAVIVALLLVVLFGFTALAFDVGYWYSVERQMQSAADAAALAGCQTIIRGGDEADARDEIIKYVGDNERGLLETATVDWTRSYIDIGEARVKVTLVTDSSAWFARVIGRDSATIPVQSVAKAGYLAGATNPIPWGMPVNRANRVTVRVAGGTEHELTEVDLNDDGIGDNVWRGTVPSSTGPVDVSAYNGQRTADYPNGVPTTLSGVAQLVNLPPTSLFKEVRISPSQLYTTPDPGGSYQNITFSVETSAPLPAAMENKVTVDLGGGMRFGNGASSLQLAKVTSTRYSGTVRAPATNDMTASYVADVGVKNTEVVPVRFTVRRSTFPVQDVKLTRCVFAPGTGVSTQIEVKLHDYQVGVPYTLKVVGGAGSIGNFMALDFTLTHHYAKGWYSPQNQQVEFPWLQPNDSYLPLIAGTFTDPRLTLHLGDVVWTQPGTGPGPQVENALDERIGTDNTQYDAWSQIDPRPFTRRLIYLPIVELLEDEGGRTAVRIVSFGAFFVTDYQGQGNEATIWGRFVEETSAPGWVVVDDPPGVLSVRVARLVKEDLDF